MIQKQNNIYKCSSKAKYKNKGSDKNWDWDHIFGTDRIVSPVLNDINIKLMQGK
jgi:hypothetical protein